MHELIRLAKYIICIPKITWKYRYLTAGVVAQVVPLDVEDAVVVHVDHFVDHGVLLVLLAEESVLAQKNAVVG